MKPSPCLHPKRVYDRSSKEWHYVPCGHCDACLCSKGYRLSERLGESMALYTHKYFVTLTFSDDYLPVAKYDNELDIYVHPYDCDYNGVVYSVDRLEVERSLEEDKDFYNTFSKYHGVPVLSRRLLILFKKRLRKEFAKYYAKQYLFIYAVGEYGPTNYRPHYHVVLCTNAPVQSSILEMCVSKAWSDYDKTRQEYLSEYGRIDFQRIISNGIRCYVSQYLTCTSNLPACLATGDFRPFYQSSPLIDADSLRFKDCSLSSLFTSCSPQTCVISLVDNQECMSLLPLGLINRIFPRCYKFSGLTHYDRVQFYSVYERAQASTGEEFVDLILNGFFGNDCFGLTKSLLVDNDLYASKQRILRHFYLSRKVCNNSQHLNVSLELYVSRIELFWSRYELLKLKNFYELQESLLTDKYNPISVSDLFMLYYDTSDDLRHLDYYLSLFGYSSFTDVFQLPSQMTYKSLMHKIVLDTTKTKKRNGYFDAHGLQRPTFISKFKTKKSCLNYFRI